MTNAPRPEFTRSDISSRSYWILSEINDLNADALNAYCYNCKVRLSWGQWLNACDYKVRVNCHSCGRMIFTDGFSSPLPLDIWNDVQKPEYFDQVWYHASRKKNWAQDIRKGEAGGLLVHAGSKLSALSRADDIFADTMEEGPIYLHSFRLRSSRSFTRIVLDDMMDDWQISINDPYEMSTCELVGNGQSSTPVSLSSKVRGAAYYNRYELPGDISIIFHGKLVQLNTVETVILERH